MADDDRKYQAWLRKQPCCACVAPPPSYVHHDTHKRTLGRRSSDLDAMPLCFRCHADLHGAQGKFASMTQDEKTAWQATRAAELRAAFLALSDSTIF